MHKTLVTALAVMLCAGPALAQQPMAERLLAFSCAGCHGEDGSSVGPSSPSIAGTDREYFIDTMLGYKNAERDSTIMTRLAKGYTEEQIEAMADFFAAQPLKTLPQPYDRELARIGAVLHEEYCEKCHEEGGRDAEFGFLAGQWVPYTRFALEDFHTGVRPQPRKMQVKLDRLLEQAGPAGIEALLHFYASQD